MIPGLKSLDVDTQDSAIHRIEVVRKDDPSACSVVVSELQSSRIFQMKIEHLWPFEMLTETRTIVTTPPPPVPATTSSAAASIFKSLCCASAAAVDATEEAGRAMFGGASIVSEYKYTLCTYTELLEVPGEHV